ncbi:MAG: hypothetical protein ACE5GX_04295 [Thermoanaerobaculia bacterium]
MSRPRSPAYRSLAVLAVTVAALAACSSVALDDLLEATRSSGGESPQWPPGFK